MKPQDLGDSLVMRNGSKEDIPGILEHFRLVHGEFVVDELKALLEHHPRFSWENSFIIEDTDSGEVVSAVFLLLNTWTLDGVELSSAEMEAVGTLEAYRYRGHMHLLNDEFEKCAKRLKPVIQAIAGIPYFYRIFGYEYAADLGGGYIVAPALVPKLPDGEKEPVSFDQVDTKGFKEYLKYKEKFQLRNTWTRTMRPEDAGYLIFETTSNEQEAFFFFLVKEKEKIVGVFYFSRWENRLDLTELYLDDYTHVDAVLRYAEAWAQKWGGIPVRVSPPYQSQVREYVSARTQSKMKDVYAWYIKIPSVTRFIEAIGPLLTDRMRASEFHDFTGNLTFIDYRQGYSLSFEKGQFTGVGEKPEKSPQEYNLRLPKAALVRLLMGYETLDELASHEPDVMCAATKKPLVRVIFPKLEASVHPFY
jgi:hypothetical protein